MCLSTANVNTGQNFLPTFFDIFPNSNRALDGVPATIDQLAEVVAEVKGQVPVYVDGGIRTGIDVFKALALGKSNFLLSL